MKATAYNVDALEKLLSLCTSSASYNPGNASIERTALIALLEEAQKSVAAVHKAKGDLAKAINLRAKALEEIPIFGGRIVAQAQANGVNAEHLKDLNILKRKLRSQPFNRTVLKSRSGGQAEQSQSEVPSNETTARKNRQLSFTAKLETLSAMVTFLENESSYTPKEPEFTLAGLKAKVASLHALHAAVINTKTALSQARNRQAELTFQNDGIYGVGKMVKRYCFAIFGRSSGIGKEISKVKLKNQS